MTYCSVVAVLASVGFTKKRFGHYAILIENFIPQISNTLQNLTFVQSIKCGSEIEEELNTKMTSKQRKAKE